MRNRIRVLALLVAAWALLVALPVMGQETPEATAEVTSEPEVVTAAPEVVRDGWDKFFDFATTNNLVLMLFVSFVVGVVSLSKPQTKGEYQRNRDDIRQQREEAAKTETKLDDLLATLNAVLNELRPRSDSPPGSVFDDIADKNANNPPITPPMAPVVLDAPINGNWGLLEIAAKRGTWPDSFRVKEEPSGYTLRWIGGIFPTPPECIVKAEYKGMRVELADRDGQLLIEFAVGALNALQRYALVVQTSDNQLNVKPTYSGQPGNYLWWECAMVDQNGFITELEQTRPLNLGDSEGQFVIEPQRAIGQATVRLALVIHEAAFADHSHVNVTGIKAVAKESGYGNDVVVRI